MSMRGKNPFNLSFGRKPYEYIDRFEEESLVLDTFTELPVTDQVFILMGVRGAGKTVAMTDIADKIRALDDWIVVKISPADDILDALFKILYHDSRVHKICLDAEIDLSLFGIGISVKMQDPGRNLTDAVNKILEALQKRGMKVLVVIDEITNTPQMQLFASAFQLFVTDNRPIFFLATAPFEEMDTLRNVKNLTFLYRAPKVYLSPLNIGAMTNAYKKVFHYSDEQSLSMAALTRGYPFAFQMLGYVVWNHFDEPFLSEDIISEYDQRLAEASYNKLWSELSETDRSVMRAIADHEGAQVKVFRDALHMDSNKFNQYRRRLRDHGLINAEQYGTISFTLPRFREYIRTQIL